MCLYLGEGFIVGSSLGTGNSITFKVKIPQGGQYPAIIRYTHAAQNPESLSLYANNQFIQQISFKPLADLDTWSDKSLDLTFKKGTNTVVLKRNENDGNVNLDYLVIP